MKKSTLFCLKTIKEVKLFLEMSIDMVRKLGTELLFLFV